MIKALELVQITPKWTATLLVRYLLRTVRICCSIENIKLKLTTNRQIETRLPGPKYSDASSPSFNVEPLLMLGKKFGK